MKKMQIFVVWLLSIVLLLTSCQSQSSKSSMWNPSEMQYFMGNGVDAVASEDGVYYVEWRVLPYLVMYYDFETGTAVPLCSNPQCSHDDPETCAAAFDNHVYGLTINNERNCLQLLSLIDSEVYAIQLDGSSRETIADMGLSYAGTNSKFYQGTFLMDENDLFFSAWQRDGSVNIYYLPLYQDAKPTKVYGAKAVDVNDYSADLSLGIQAVYGNLAIFRKTTTFAVPDGTTAEDVGQPLETVELMYCDAKTGTVETIAENYESIAPWGDKFLIAGSAGIASWDPSTGEVVPQEWPEELAGYDDYFMEPWSLYNDDGNFYVCSGEYYADTGKNTLTLFVLDEELNLKNIVDLPGITCLFWGSNDLATVSIDRSSGQSKTAVFTLPKSKLAEQKEVTWRLGNGYDF